MRLTGVLRRVISLARNSSQTGSQTSTARATEQRDESSMADFVRILREHDRKSPGDA